MIVSTKYRTWEKAELIWEIGYLEQEITNLKIELKIANSIIAERDEAIKACNEITESLIIESLTEMENLKKEVKN